MDDRYGVRKQDNSYSRLCSKSLLNLPTELLVKILFYLPIHDRVMMRHVYQRFEDASKVPLLWKEFVWRYKPHHVRKVINLLEVCGEQVRQIYFPGHVTPTRILEMARYCKKITYLSLPKGTQLTLDHLQEITYTMSHLEQLDLFAYCNFQAWGEVLWYLYLRTIKYCQEKFCPPENFYPRTKFFGKCIEIFCPTLKIFVPHGF